jgi:hypothetical protein
MIHFNTVEILTAMTMDRCYLAYSYTLKMKAMDSS